MTGGEITCTEDLKKTIYIYISIYHIIYLLILVWGVVR